MLELATSAWPQLEVVRLRSDRFTVRDTLPEIYSYVHGAELTMLLGSDVAKHMVSWPGITNLLTEMSLAIGLRGADSIDDVSRVIQLLEAEKPISVQYVVTPHIHAASSQSRKQLAQDRDLDPVVVAYALRNALYTSPA
jgi:nicotinic acid mononucleotide adenylyltransferase